MQNFIRKIFNLFGLNLTRINVRNVPSFQIVRALKVNNINVVFDVGANLGQFALELRKYGYDGKIVSFEPLSQAYEKLVKLAEKDEKWFVHPRCALGASDAEIEINVAANLASSSILPMLAKHENAAPHAKYTHKDQATLIKLDSVFENYASLEENIFIKIDTQGYEWAVLDGAEKALKQSKGVLLELTLTPLYEGQKLWLDLINRLESVQYSIYAIQPGFTDKETGETLQVDGLFFKALPSII